MSKQDKRKWGAGRYVVAGLSGVFVVAAAAYVGGYFMAGDDLPQNSTVDGVRIGGMPADEAITKLKSELAKQYETPITVSDGDKTASISPTDAGMTIDYEATVAKAGAGRSWNPVHIWDVLRGGGPIAPEVHRDPAKVADAVNNIASTFAVEPQDATLSLQDGVVVKTSGEQGQALNVNATAQKVNAAWPGETQVEAVVTSSEPELTTDAVDKAATTLETALAGDVTLTTDKGDIVITPEMIASAAKVDTSGGKADVSFDQDKLWKAMQPALKPLALKPAKDASYTLKDGKPVVVAAQPGDQIKKEDALKAAMPLLDKADSRSAKVTVTTLEPKIPTADAAKLGVKEVIGEFTTYFPYTEYRNVNLTLAAKAINGSYVAPGETWSYNDVVGERTEAKGYVAGYVVLGNHMGKEVGGGVSQVATTTFNAAFFAGMTDVEHHPHSMYFSRYPAGRESTVYYPTLDVKFRNDTPYGVLMQAYTTLSTPGKQGSVTVKVWSTKQYDIKSSELVKSNFYSGTRIVSSDPGCIPQSPAQGFTVNYKRLFYKDGKLVKSEPFSWKYSAIDQIVCK